MLPLLGSRKAPACEPPPSRKPEKKHGETTSFLPFAVSLELRAEILRYPKYSDDNCASNDRENKPSLPGHVSLLSIFLPSSLPLLRAEEWTLAPREPSLLPSPSDLVISLFYYLAQYTGNLPSQKCFWYR